MNVEQLVAGDPRDATVRHLRVRDQLLRIVTTSSEANDLVTETFYPDGMLGVFEASSRHDPDLTVVDLTCDASDIQELLRRESLTAARGEFELTRGFRLPRYDSASHTVFTLRDVNSDEVAGVVRTEGRVTVLRPESGLGDRWLTRIVRDIATRLAKAAGSLVLHSSAFVFDDGAYLVIGDSGAGKSTTAIALARRLPSAGWMGNDRIHAEWQGRHYRVTACPLPLAVNKGSLDVMGVTDFGSWPVRAGLPGSGSDWDQFQGEDKLKLSSREVNRFLQVPVIPNMRLAGVLLPRVDLASGYSFGLTTPAHTAEVITRNCFSLDDNLYGEDWLGVPARHTAAAPSINAFLEHITQLPVLRCSMGSAGDVAKLAGDFQEAVKT
ncbi:hypothetical protein ACIP6I_33030 [Streptomyces anulatus]